MSKKQDARAEISWQESNLALFGSDLDKQVKKESAMHEEAWLPVLQIHGPHLFVWRIEDFKIKPIDQNDYGQFFNGDSYIVLSIRQRGEALMYDVHFWIGQHSSADEYGTAAYKTVELDTLLNGAAVQHREVENYESKLFKSYFPALRVMNGGVNSGFRKVEPNAYQPRLLHFQLQDRRNVVMQEVSLSVNSLDSKDVFILDLGSKAFQWNGNQCNKEERYSAAQFLQHLSSERLGKCKIYVLDENQTDDNEEFRKALPDTPVKRTKRDLEVTKCLYRLSDAEGNLKFEMIASSSAPRKDLNPNDVYFIDVGTELFVYIGANCSMAEKQNAMSYAHAYLQHTDHLYVPVHVVAAGQLSDELDRAWDPDRSDRYYAD